MGISEIQTCLSTCTLSEEFLSPNGWFTLIGGIVITVFLILAAAFMISRAMNKRDWEAIIRLEMLHLFIAVIWIGLIAVIANLTCTISCSITNEESPFISAVSYINDVNKDLQSLSESLFDLAKNIRIESAISYEYEVLFYNPYDGCDSIATTYENYALLLMPFLASMMIQQYALIFINQVAFKILLPIGIMMRLIPGLRDSAAYVIGIAFALYIVLPLTYIIAEKATSGIELSLIDTGSKADCVSVSDIQIILQNIGKLLPQAVFFPALSSIITITAARAFSEIFKYDFAELKG